ncbi:phage protein [Streptococcus pneumoniae]|nr:phage protein [Streptococcus pneumoniae]
MIPKYRVWDKLKNEMYVVEQINFNCGEFESIGYGISFLRGADKVELMQSTGLFDRNGKEIFEGDVVRQVRTQPTTENEVIIGVVTMIEGAWLIMNDNEQLASKLWSETDENEIIGNIYENKELLDA